MLTASCWPTDSTIVSAACWTRPYQGSAMTNTILPTTRYYCRMTSYRHDKATLPLCQHITTTTQHYHDNTILPCQHHTPMTTRRHHDDTLLPCLHRGCFLKRPANTRLPPRIRQQRQPISPPPPPRPPPSPSQRKQSVPPLHPRGFKGSRRWRWRGGRGRSESYGVFAHGTGALSFREPGGDAPGMEGVLAREVPKLVCRKAGRARRVQGRG